MIKSKYPTTEKVFRYFEEISAVPRESENMDGIAQYCMDFAQCHSLKAVRDEANNVVIFKEATPGYENAEPIILQGHLDMVCQKEKDCQIDFLADGIEIYTDGDFLKARGTTLGADNGIAVAMVLAILDSDDIPHPAIEAVFTTDEEIGMIGALALDTGILQGNRMINLDAEEDDSVTVSCAGGSDFRMTLPLERRSYVGTEITVTLGGLRGGHSGVEIHSGRVNADILAGRFLGHMKNHVDFGLIGIHGGVKGNVIPPCCEIRLCTQAAEKFVREAQAYLAVIQKEVSEREPDFCPCVSLFEERECSVISPEEERKILFALLCAPNGVQEMSAEIEGLVESSLNLGILKTEEDRMIFHFTLRSNKMSALCFLEEKLTAFSDNLTCKAESFGHYPAWEFKGDSELQRLYRQVYCEQFGADPRVEAIHAGLECGVFASKIADLDCIAIGPQLYDVHTANERLSISSAERVYRLLLEILKRCG